MKPQPKPRDETERTLTMLDAIDLMLFRASAQSKGREAGNSLPTNNGNQA